MAPVKAFYFSTSQRKLRFGDGRSIVVGETHTVEGEVKLAVRGLHASETLMNALVYAPGTVLYQVEMSGQLQFGSDKMVASERKYLREFDIKPIMQEFCRILASSVFHNVCDLMTQEEIEIVEGFLKTGGNSSAVIAILNKKFNLCWGSSSEEMSTIKMWSLWSIHHAIKILNNCEQSMVFSFINCVEETTRARCEGIYYSNAFKIHAEFVQFLQEKTGWEF